MYANNPPSQAIEGRSRLGISLVFTRKSAQTPAPIAALPVSLIGEI
jgi:hypothetical protein